MTKPRVAPIASGARARSALCHRRVLRTVRTGVVTLGPRDRFAGPEVLRRLDFVADFLGLDTTLGVRGLVGFGGVMELEG